jgi:hypothetical protein
MVCAQQNYKSTLSVHPDELSDEAKIVFESLQGSSSCIQLSKEVIIKQEALVEKGQEKEAIGDHMSERANDDELTNDDSELFGGLPCELPLQRSQFLVFGAPACQPIGDRTSDNSTAEVTMPELMSELQMSLAQEPMAKEKATTKAIATAAAASANAEAAATVAASAAEAMEKEAKAAEEASTKAAKAAVAAQKRANAMARKEAKAQAKAEADVAAKADAQAKVCNTCV